ncbi:acyl-protein thioesterase 1-like [Adelges cooleyi]|uniref:acyl-protein thioesterase 1-like n=1 Tax=Adelges cooleyi TaxID=133065 RepID=UPI00218048C7|nr:acyl-protein thioesterase 1-like [Adelges cooleyi]
MFSDTIETIPPSVKHSTTIVFFHGLGESGKMWTSTLAKLRKPHTKIVCPSADKISMTMYKGFATKSWFDMTALKEMGENESSFLQAVDLVHVLLDKELSSSCISSKKVLIGGFSQGGALAVYAALTYHKPLAGILMLSSWIPLHIKFPNAATNNTDIPILQCHGTNDSVLDFQYGRRTSEVMKSFVTKHEFIIYQGLNHCTNKEELEDIKTFINKVLP